MELSKAYNGSYKVLTNWVNLIMGCITTPYFFVLINGVPKRLIQPQRGLRQGCSLSLYLFILCTEVFSILISQAERRNLIKGLKFSKDLSINQLLFADDSLIFIRATIEDYSNLKNIFLLLCCCFSSDIQL